VAVPDRCVRSADLAPQSDEVTTVEFHTGVADPLAFACRLLRKAYRRGARVAVTAPPARLAALDEQLWTFEAQDFVPHLRWSSARAAQAARTPIWLIDGTPPPGSPPVLVNLGAEPLPASAAVGAFERIIEIVADGDEDRRSGRARWRHYEAQGLPITHHRAARLPG
jgi:DNA polymerase-3 subunit chi